jgi:hypothetical protein
MESAGLILESKNLFQHAALVYSSCSSTKGSTDRARCAGIQVATKPTSTMATTARPELADRERLPDTRPKPALGSPEFPGAILQRNP